MDPKSQLFPAIRQLKLECNGPTDERAAIIVVSEANFDLKFETSNLNYPSLYVYIAILVASEAMATSKWP